MQTHFHPSVKLTFYLMAVCFTMILAHPYFALISLFCAAAYVVCLKRSLKPCLMILPLWVIVTLVNPLFNTMGDHPLFTLFGRPFTFEALMCGMTSAASFSAVMLWLICYAEEMTSEQFIALFARLIPTLSLLLVMVFRLIPDYMRRAKRISGARRCIGKGIDERAGFKSKVLEGVSILSVMTGWALENAMVEADSMRARGYGCADRTHFDLLRFTSRDACALGALLLGVVVTAVCALKGAAYIEYYPAIRMAGFGVSEGIFALLMLLPTLLFITEDIKWRSSISAL